MWNASFIKLSQNCYISVPNLFYCLFRTIFQCAFILPVIGLDLVVVTRPTSISRLVFTPHVLVFFWPAIYKKDK